MTGTPTDGTLVLTRHDVRRLMSLDECIEAVEGAFRQHALGNSISPRVLGSHVHHVGPSGAGSTVKIVNQLLTAVNTVAVAEASVLGTRAGVSPEVLYEVLRTSYGGSRMLERALPRIMARDFTPGGPIDLILKDLSIIDDVGRDLNVRLLMSSVARELFTEGRALGLGAEDMAAVVKPLEQAAGVEVRAQEPKVGFDGGARI